MARFIIFATLLTAQFAVGLSEYLVISRCEQDRVSLKVEGAAESCLAQQNNDAPYKYTPGDWRRLQQNVWSLEGSNTCTLKIQPVRQENTGNWTITTFLAPHNTANTTSFKVCREKTRPLIPASELTVYEGYYAVVKIDTTDPAECKATAPNGTTIDLLNLDRPDFYRFGQCGFRALLKSVDSGTWTLTATEKACMIYTGEISIDVLQEMDVNRVMPDISLERGDKAELYVNIRARITYCQLEDPTGLVLPITLGSCRYTIPVVTTSHAGDWTARYGVLGKAESTVLRFKVITYDPQSMDSSVTVMENNSIQLLCHSFSSTPRTLPYCKFTRPDGYVLNLTPGVGTDSYSGFNMSYSPWSSLDLYCGLIIHNPTGNDYGSWKCDIGSDGDDYAVLVFRVPEGEVGADVKVSARNVSVQKNDSFEINCVADAPLSYCWFQSPDGTVYPVFKRTSQTPSSLPYVGSGFLSGECGAKIAHADVTHRGIWTCNLGIVNGTQKNRTFSVTVNKAYITASPFHLMATSQGRITLGCYMYPTVTDRAVRYCRWVRPDKYGIYVSSGQYTTRTNVTGCELTIASVNYTVDLGKWICVAGLLGLDMEESRATVIVTKINNNL